MLSKEEMGSDLNMFWGHSHHSKSDWA